MNSRNNPVLLLCLPILLSACTAAPLSGSLKAQNAASVSRPHAPAPQYSAQMPTPATAPQNAAATADLQSQIDELRAEVDVLRMQQEALARLLDRSESGERTAPSAKRARSSAAQSQHIQTLYRAGLYAQVIRQLRGLDGSNSTSLETQENLYLLILSHWHLLNCESVINIGNRFAARFPHQANTPDVLYRIGQCQTRLQQHDIARQTWKRLVSTYPNSYAARQAARLLKH